MAQPLDSRGDRSGGGAWTGAAGPVPPEGAPLDWCRSLPYPVVQRRRGHGVAAGVERGRVRRGDAMRRWLAIGAAVLAALGLTGAPAFAGHRGAVEVVRGAGDGGDVARGVVFRDDNRNSVRDVGEPGIGGVAVSNGREVVLTDEDGAYALPVRDDMNLFVTKPAGYDVPVDRFMVPQFAYVHKPAGSPPLRFRGLAPTGPLPEAVNFPLVPSAVGDDFTCLVFGDTQTYSARELGFLRDSLGRMLVERDMDRVACLLFLGDIMGDDLDLFPRFKEIVAAAGVPQYFVGGNHDIDFDAPSDADSFDTFRREWGPQTYSFAIGNVHFVVLDNVRYPCNGIDPHPFCAADAAPEYNGVLTEDVLVWLANDLAHVPPDRLVVVAAHIPFQTFTDTGWLMAQTDNFDALARVLEGRRVLTLSAHTHTLEQILPGEHYEGFLENTGVGPSPFHQIIAGAVSGSWWSGDLDDDGVPRATQRLGAPRGYLVLDFDDKDVVDTYVAFGEEGDMHASLNTPRFRAWAEKLFAYVDGRPEPGSLPPVTINDLGDTFMVTREDLAGGTWLAVNVWNGTRESEVTVRVGDRPAVNAVRTQEGEGEAKRVGARFADPAAILRQATMGRMAFRSTEGGDETAGFRTFMGMRWMGPPGPVQSWMLARASSHLWRADLPADLPAGLHVIEVRATDRHGRTSVLRLPFEVVEALPDWEFREALFAR